MKEAAGSENGISQAEKLKKKQQQLQQRQPTSFRFSGLIFIVNGAESLQESLSIRL